MAKLVHIGGPSDNSRHADVLFIHGLDGHPVNTWSYSGDLRQFWPQWISDAHPDIGVWSLAYEASSSRWIGEPLPLFDRIDNTMFLLEDRDVGLKPLVIIAHSFGGLLAKQLLRLGATRSQSFGQAIAENTRGILFFATPHSGSAVANIANWVRVAFRPSVMVDELQHHSPYLREINDWFRDHFDRLGLHAEVYRETKPYLKQIIVDAGSSDPGVAKVPVIPLEENHVSICKFQSNDHPLYRRVERFVSRHLSRTSLTPVIPRDPTALRCYISITFSGFRRPAERLQDKWRDSEPDNFLFFDSAALDTVDDCVERAKSAHVCIFILNTHMHNPHVRAVLDAEIDAARKLFIPCLFYLDSRKSKQIDVDELDRALTGLQITPKSSFNNWSNLRTNIFVDLFNLSVLMGREPEEEKRPELIEKHKEIHRLLEKQEYELAKEMNKRIIEAHPFSPRAHYNQACICSRLAELHQPDSTTDARFHVWVARRHLSDAFRFKILHLISQGTSALDPRSATERIENDPDLAYLFRVEPDVLRFVQTGKFSAIQLHFSGCICGCQSDAAKPSHGSELPMRSVAK